MNFERRHTEGIEIEYREDNTANRIKGKGIVFNSESVNLGGFIELILPEAVRDIDWDDCVSIYNHNINLVLGRSPDTMDITIDDIAVRYSIDPADSTHTKDVIIHIERKDIKGSSFGFIIAPNGDEWERRPDGMYLRTIHKFEVIKDISPVLFPAYPDTTVAKRSLSEIRESFNIPQGIKTDIARKRMELLNINK